MVDCTRWMVATTLMVGACSSASDDAFVSADGGDSSASLTAGSDDGGPGGTTDDGGDENADGATATDDPGVDETGSGDDGDSSGEPADESCDGIDCGAGTCVGRDGAPACMCDAGYAPLGLTCIACAPEPPASIELELATGTLRVTVGGVVPPLSEYEDAVIELRNRDSGDTVVLGNTHDGELAVNALPGAYDVVFRYDSGATLFPHNEAAIVDKVDVQDGVDHIVDLQVVRLTGTILLDGAEPPSSEFNRGNLRLRDAATGDSVLLGTTRYGEYDVLVLPGIYDLHYEHVVGADVPANADAWIGQVVVPPGSEPIEYDIDIDMITLEGEITIDGETPPPSAYDNGRLTLVGALPDDLIPLAETRYGGFSKNVVAGHYRVVYEWVAGAGTVPANTHAELPALDTKLGGSQSIDIPVVSVDGTFSLGEDGVPPPSDPTDDGNVFLRRGGDSVYLGNTAYGGYERRVIPGDYDVYFGQDSSRGGVPTNTNARIDENASIIGGTRDVLIPAAQIEGVITIGGQAPPVSDYDDGHIYLRNRDTLDSVLLANTRESMFSQMVVPGDYEIVYAAETPGGSVPVNAGAVVGSVTVGDEGPLAVDVPVIQIAGGIDLGGNAPPEVPTDVGQLFLVDALTLDPIYIGSTLGGGYSQRITPGDYLVYYRMQATTGLVPANTNANLGCWTIE